LAERLGGQASPWPRRNGWCILPSTQQLAQIMLLLVVTLDVPRGNGLLNHAGVRFGTQVAHLELFCGGPGTLVGGRTMTLVSPHLLIADDDRDFRETLGSMFEGRGFRALLAADGDEALRIVRRNEIHVVLMDLHMPRLSGLDVLRRIKAHRAELPCILISGALDEHIVAEAKALPVFSLLNKPVSLDEVTSTVGNALRRIYHWPSN
jgi:CheY-like chemotaxis protein